MLHLIIFLNLLFTGYIYLSKASKKQSSGRQDDLVKCGNTFSPYLEGREKFGSSLHHIQLHRVRRSPHALKTFGPYSCIGYQNHIMPNDPRHGCSEPLSIAREFPRRLRASIQHAVRVLREASSHSKPIQGQSYNKANDEEARYSLLRCSRICCCCWLCSCFCVSRCQRLSATPSLPRPEL